MREFNLEEAKAGKPVCTRDGHSVRIICFDAKRINYPIIALVENKGEEVVVSYNLDGSYCTQDNELDLFMATTKHEGWINIYRLGETIKRLTGEIYTTEEEALKHKNDYGGNISTQHIEWEE